jgi:16S rRNA processing protein RimM
MIDIKKLYDIGVFGKPHGIKGEIILIANDRRPDFKNDLCIICEIDGIPVPFFVESFRNGRCESTFIKFENINSEQDAKIFTGKTAYSHASSVKEREKQENPTFVGYHVVDASIPFEGVITDVDASTDNALLKVRCGEKDYIIPFGFFRQIDYVDEVIHMKFPEGFMDINN